MRIVVSLLLFASLFVVANLGAVGASAADPAPPTLHPTPDDTDGDGVPNSTDLCPEQGTSDVGGEPVAADGCPPFRADIIGESTAKVDLDLLAKDPKDNGAQCINARGQRCSFEVKLTLSAASAKKLKLHNEIADVKVAGSRGGSNESFAPSYDFGFSSAEKRALKKAKEATMTLSATYVYGSDAPVALPSKTFKVDHNTGEKWFLSTSPTLNSRTGAGGD